ncbi:AI-2 transport protein TqsA [Nocardioides dokdonensis FR1436]|uniref:AI-2 transport protein TqsA n=1 Tax=Nocardioides dokdonensis FR1436 TaxID=1300347 RepID=A0A1A9GLU3_9ACTN|nr:AI-2E family transporter [Nocardioides dokdonensis]ANH38451.1 AI-2 transport protein TqsA [Nocardioides dokdonensis FR1436]
MDEQRDTSTPTTATADPGAPGPGLPGPDGQQALAQPDPAAPAPGGRLRRRSLRPRSVEDEESLAHRLFQQWSLLRDERERQLTPPELLSGSAAYPRTHVPPGVDLAAAWAWRFLVIVAAGGIIAWTVGYLSVIVLPIVVALLISALAVPVVDLLTRWRVPRGAAALVVLVGGLATVSAALTFVGQQVANGATDLADQTVKGLGQIRVWLEEGPLNASDSQIDRYINDAQNLITNQTSDGEVVSRITEVGTTLTHVFAGFFIVLFATFFFMADGRRIWSWLVRLAPRAARARVDSSGRVAWISLTQFVRATVIVALVDAIGIAGWAWFLGVPFVAAIGVLVFLGAFVPMIGATIAGTVAILVALVDQGPWAALLMLIGVIVVQQVEGHVLQPFLMGRWVSVHPLAVIVAIATGVLVAGIAGALVAVPLAAAANAVIQHLAANTAPGDDPEVELAEDYDETGARVDVPEESSSSAVGDTP